MSTTKTSGTNKSASKKKDNIQESNKEVDPIASKVKQRYATGLYNINQLASQFMVHASRIEKILGK